MATLQQLSSSELTNFFIAMCTTWHARCSVWPAFLSKETLMNVTATTLRNLDYLENLPGTLFPLFSNLDGINYTYLVLPLSGITSKLILATSRIMIIIHTTTPPLRKLSTEKSLFLFHPVPLKTNGKIKNTWQNGLYPFLCLGCQFIGEHPQNKGSLSYTSKQEDH